MGTMTPVQTQNKSTTDNKSRNQQATAALKTPTLKKPDPVEIIYRIRKNPDNIAREDIMTLQNTLGNHAVAKLLTEINSKSKEKLDQVKQDEKDKTADSNKAADKKSAETKIQLNAADNIQKDHKQDVPLNKVDTQKNNLYEADHKTEPRKADNSKQEAQASELTDSGKKKNIRKGENNDGILSGQKKEKVNTQSTGKTDARGTAEKEREESSDKAIEVSGEKDGRVEKTDGNMEKGAGLVNKAINIKDKGHVSNKVNEDTGTAAGNADPGLKEASANTEAVGQTGSSKGEGQAAPAMAKAAGSLPGVEGQKVPSKPVSVKIKGENPGEILNQLEDAPPAAVFSAYTQAMSVSSGALESQKRNTEKVIPEIPTPTGLEARQTSGKMGSKLTPEKHGVPDRFNAEKSGGKVYEGMPPEFNARENSGEDANPEAIMAQARAQSAKAPQIGMSGEADPSQMEGFKAEAAQSVQAAKQAELAQVNNEFGENSIYPQQDKSILKAAINMKKITPPKGEVMQSILVSQDIADRINQPLGASLKSQIGAKKNEYQKGKEKFDADVVAAKADTDSQIDREKAEAREKQLGEQSKAKAEVEGLRGEWRSEINGAVAEYDKNAGAASQEKSKEIGDIKTQKEGEVQKELANADKEAQKEYKTAKANAEEKKKEGEKEDKGWFGKAWDWVKDKAQQAIDAVKKAVNSIFDGLRKAVKFIFDKAKQAAMGIIEAGRKLIVGLIKELGKFLKSLVKIVFARFPELANKICNKIDNVVNKAVDAVNKAAELLKKGVTAALNLLAKTLDGLFGAIQSLYNGILSSIGKLLNGGFKELFLKALEVAQIAAEIALAFATGGGSVLAQIVLWLAKTLPELFKKVTAVLGFVDTIRNFKMNDIKQFLNPTGIGEFLVKGLFGELSPLNQVEGEDKKKDEAPDEGGKATGLLKVFQVLSGVFKMLKGVYNKVAGAINKVLPVINISTKPFFNMFSMIYAGVVKAMEVVQNPAEALEEGVGKLKEAIASFFGGIKTKVTETAGSIKEKLAILGKPAQLMKLIANKAIDMVLGFIIMHPPSALIKAVFKGIEAVSGKSIVELVRQYIPFADKLLNKIAESGPVSGLLKPLAGPVNRVGGMIDDVSVKAVSMVDDSEQKSMGVFGSGAKLLKELGGNTPGSKNAGGDKKGGGGILGVIKGGIHARLLAFGQKLLEKGKGMIKTSFGKLKGIFGKKFGFKLGSENHHLWVEKVGNKNVVMMASKEEEIYKKIEDFKKQLANVQDEKEKGKIVKKIGELEVLTGRLSAISDPKQISDKDINKVTRLITQIYDALLEVSEATGENEKTAIDEFIAGERPFDDAVLDEYVGVYSSKISENDTNWSWNKSIPGGNKLSAKQRATIRQKAIEEKAIPPVEIKKVKGLKYGYADFMGAGVVKIRYVLPKELWKTDDKTQFDWLNNKLKSEHPELYPEGCTELQPPKYTWHHSEGKGIDSMGGDDDGVMYLISYGVHHAYTHNGGRTKAHWADAPRTKKGKKRGKKRK